MRVDKKRVKGRSNQVGQREVGTGEKRGKAYTALKIRCLDIFLAEHRLYFQDKLLHFGTIAQAPFQFFVLD